MAFARGATLTTATTFGHADTSNLGPTAGNGFYKRWPDDLALLQDLGITDIRLTFDWPRLQPKPGPFDGAWSDLFEQIVAAADAIELRVWATLHDGAEPRWITNEGGLQSDDVTEKWWPRYVEQVADRFGAGITGWIPFAGIDDRPSIAGWRNTWTTLNSDDAPVVVAIDPRRIDDIPNYLELSDLIGLVMTHDDLTDPEPNDDDFTRIETQLHETISHAAESASDHDLVITQFTPRHEDPDVASRVVTAFVDGVDAAIADGIDLGLAFIDPAISGPDAPAGLLGSDRAPQPAATTYLPTLY